MYPLIKLPKFANKDIYTFSKDEAKEYYKWFMNIKNERLQILESEVQKSYPEWKLDYTRNSLVILYEWFETKVMYRNMEDEEKEVIKKQINKTPLFTDIIPIPELTFTDETVSICFDVSLYFGDTLIFNLPNAIWKQKINSSSNIDYAQPLVVSKTGKALINPRRIAENLANFKLKNSLNSISFLELFNQLIIEFQSS